MSLAEKLGVKLGVYEHFKGGFYYAMMCVKDTDTKEPKVVYLSLNNLTGTPDGEEYARDLKKWNEPVMWRDGQIRPRYYHTSLPR